MSELRINRDATCPDVGLGQGHIMSYMGLQPQKSGLCTIFQCCSHIRYRDSVGNLNALVSVSNGMLAIILCSIKILSTFYLGVLAYTGSLV